MNIYQSMMSWNVAAVLNPAAKDQAQQVQQSGVDSALTQADSVSKVVDIVLGKLGSWWQSAIEMIPNLAVAILVMVATLILANIVGRIIIPNKEVFQSPLENYLVTGSRRVDVDVGVPYDSDLAQVEQVLRDAAAGLSWRMEDKEVSVWCLEFDDSAISWKVGVWMKYPGDTGFYDAKHDAQLAIKKALDEADITIPLPIRTLNIPDRTIDRLLPHDQQHDKKRDKEKSNDFDQNHRSDQPHQEGSDRDSTGDSSDGDEDGES
jgi:hypothetical protein